MTVWAPGTDTDSSPVVPQTSVIITSYNYAAFLSVAIASVLAQTDSDFELLVVEDGSTDGSLEVARAVLDPRIRVIPQAHRGVGAARNVGIRASRGRYIAFLDADDIWVPEKLARQCEVLDRRPEVGFVYTRFGVIDADGRVLSHGRSFLAGRPSGAIIRDLLKGNVIGTPSTICFRRPLAEDHQIWFDETGAHADDWHFYLRVAPHTLIEYLPSTLVYHRRHARNRSNHVPTLRAETLRTGRYALTVAREQLVIEREELDWVERRMLAYVEALSARSYVKAHDLSSARTHAVQSLNHYPWNVREAALYLMTSIGWVPRAVSRCLK